MSGRYWWLLTSQTRGWRRCRWWRSRAVSRWRLFAARARRWAIGDFRRTSQSVPPNDRPLNMKTRSSKQLVRCCWHSIVLLLSYKDERRIKPIFASAIDSFVMLLRLLFTKFSRHLVRVRVHGCGLFCLFGCVRLRYYSILCIVLHSHYFCLGVCVARRLCSWRAELHLAFCFWRWHHKCWQEPDNRCSLTCLAFITPTGTCQNRTTNN